jgi:hypothetical protein
MNRGNLVFTVFLVNVVWFTCLGDTGRNLRDHEEHKTNCEKAERDKSAVAKHAWTNDHRIKWDEATNIYAFILF